MCFRDSQVDQCTVESGCDVLRAGIIDAQETRLTMARLLPEDHRQLFTQEWQDFIPHFPAGTQCVPEDEWGRAFPESQKLSCSVRGVKRQG